MKADVKDEVQFRQFLKKSGKKEHVINGLVRQVLTFETYLATKGLKGLEAASEQELHAYVETLDASEIKERMRGLALYFKFSGNNSLARLASDIREQGIAKTRMAFKLREFRGVNPEEDARLEAIGIITVEDIQYLIEWVANAGFDGISPLPKKSATLSLQPANCQRFLNMAHLGRPLIHKLICLPDQGKSIRVDSSNSPFDRGLALCNLAIAARRETYLEGQPGWADSLVRKRLASPVRFDNRSLNLSF